MLYPSKRHPNFTTVADVLRSRYGNFDIILLVSGKKGEKRGKNKGMISEDNNPMSPTDL